MPSIRSSSGIPGPARTHSPHRVRSLGLFADAPVIVLDPHDIILVELPDGDFDERPSFLRHETVWDLLPHDECLADLERYLLLDTFLHRDGRRISFHEHPALGTMMVILER